MNQKLFLARLAAIISIVTVSGATVILQLFRQIVSPNWDETLEMIRVTAPFCLAITIAYMAVVYVVARPVLKFLSYRDNGLPVDEPMVLAAQDRAAGLPYILAGTGFIAFLIGSPAISWISLLQLDWPLTLGVFGIVGGVITGFIGVPLYLYMGNWLTGPALGQTIESMPEAGTCRRAGIKIGLGAKLVLTVVSLVGAGSGYALAISYSENQEPEKAAFYFILWLGVVLVSMVLAYAAGLEITRPIMVLQSSARKVASGEYDEPIKLVSTDEMAELGETVNAMMRTIVGGMREMRGVVSDLESGIRKMDETVETILDVSSLQSSGATEQASAVQESSAIAEEIVATARGISDRAESVNRAADATLSACREGKALLDGAGGEFESISTQAGEISRAMRDLEQSFNETYKIVEWIEDVAEQTELLSLNAALEAAGAGELGKRFGVVAEATRRLAARSAEAAGEIRSLILSIQDRALEASEAAAGGESRVEEGARSIREVAEAFANISRLAESTSNSANEITLSTRQQSTASEELASSIAEVRDVAKRVEEGSREVAASISMIKEFADHLRITIEKSAIEK